MDEKQQEIRKNRRLFWGGFSLGVFAGMLIYPASRLCDLLLNIGHPR